MYDSDNRLVEVQTSRKGLYWEKQASYEYYLHGPLKRLELGVENVQGIDYHYTLQGWLKGMNNGLARTDAKSSQFPKDVFGMRLDYFVNDFATTGTNPLNISTPAVTSTNSLYNGNIAAWSSVNFRIDTNVWGQVYRYDALNRLKLARTYTGSNALAFLNKYTYDQGGNLTKLKRHDASGTIIDSMAYNYALNAQNKLLNNKLNSVNDLGNATGMPTGNSAYLYDADGRLSRDLKENLNMRWTMDNKLRQVVKGTKTPRYLYDPMGNRVMKRLPSDSVEYIVLDATGNEMERVSGLRNGSALVVYKTESNVYGSGRLGTLHLPGSPGPDTIENRSNARYTYEMTDHLGNVRATVSDQKSFVTIAGGYTLTANVLSAIDNYPYGMAINTRSFAASSYRYGFNTQEKSPEIVPDHTTALFWEYDARTGRRWERDPKSKVAPNWSPYRSFYCNPNMYSDPDGAFESTEVSKNRDGSYRVEGGQADGDRNIYVVDGNGNRTGEIIGKSLTEHSFLNDQGGAVRGATINPSDNSGRDFLNNEIISSGISLQSYIWNATGREPLDFKTRNIETERPAGQTETEFMYRGMPFENIHEFGNQDGAQTTFASARDFGNAAAGYMAGVTGKSWALTRVAFNALESWQNKSFSSEGAPTQAAERIGHIVGLRIFNSEMLRRKAIQNSLPVPLGPKY